MSEIWIKEAKRLGDGTVGGAMDLVLAPARAVWHTTESGAGDEAFRAVAAHLIRNSAEPHLLYDPNTDRLGQFGPLDKSARALRNDGAARTNRIGKVCVQIEVLGRASKPFTGYWNRNTGRHGRPLPDGGRTGARPRRGRREDIPRPRRRPRYFRDLAGPFPGRTAGGLGGGVNADNAAGFLTAGAHAVCAGSEVVPPAAVAAGD